MTLLERRIGLLFAIFLLLMVIAGGRALQLATFQGARLANAATSQQQRDVPLPAARGTITDRNGVALAVSEAAYDISATPYLVERAPVTAGAIAPILRIPESEIITKISDPKKGYALLAKRVPARTAERIRKLALAGIDLTPTERRVYPRRYSASQVLGFINGEGVGAAGLEYRLQKSLRGADGIRRVTRDGAGDSITVRDLRPSQPGDNVRLTIDANIQDETERVLRDVGAKYQPKGATAIVTDPRNGDVLALANWPQIDANHPGQAPPDALMDRAVGFTYEPGSTFKAFTVAGALDDGKVTPETQFDLPPTLTLYDRTLHNNEERGAATMTTSEILAHSDNVGAATIGINKLGSKRFDYWTRRFGFGKPTGVTLPGEEQGFLLPLAKYSGTSMLNLPLGQGQSVTPMQINQAYTAIASGGVMRSPQVIRSFGGRRVARPKGRRVISPTTARQVRTMLEGVLAPGGTASEVKIPGYTLAGKTGTANKVAPDGTYSKSKYVASFVGFAPAKDPRLLVTVVVDEPQQGSIYGGEIAAPAFGRIAAFALDYLRVPPG